MSAYEYLSGLLAEKFGVPTDKIAPEANLTDLGLDSLSIVELVFDVEDEFDVEIPEEEADFQSLEEAAALVEKLVLASRG